MARMCRSMNPTTRRQPSVASDALEYRSGFRVVVIDRGAALPLNRSSSPPSKASSTSCVAAIRGCGTTSNDVYYYLGRDARSIRKPNRKRSAANLTSRFLPTRDRSRRRWPLPARRSRRSAQAILVTGPRGRGQVIEVPVHRRARTSEQGFPGRLNVCVNYQILEATTHWRLNGEATCDRDTVVNLVKSRLLQSRPGCQDHLTTMNSASVPTTTRRSMTGTSRPARFAGVSESKFDLPGGIRRRQTATLA